MEMIKQINEFESKDMQDVYLKSIIESRDIIRRRKLDNSESSFSKKAKNNSYIYHVKVNGQLHEVCKKAFISILGIRKKRVDRIFKLLSMNEIPKDIKGLKSSANAIPVPVCQKNYDFIRALDAKESHYSGNSKKYLGARLNIKILHSTFISQNPNEMLYDFFRIYFNENFDYSFGRLQVDARITCEELGEKLRNTSLRVRLY